jgi:hypothetical protein
LRHEAEEKAGLAEKERRRKRWEEKNTIPVKKAGIEAGEGQDAARPST